MSEPFAGFDRPKSNFFILPHDWINITAAMKTWAEHKVVEYVARHTWGYQEYGIVKRITLDEFQHGRRYSPAKAAEIGRERIDNGTGLGKKAIIDGIRLAVQHGFLIEQVDAGDRARVRKYYCLRMAEGFGEDTPDVRPSNPEVRRANSSGSESEQRSEKEPSERNGKKETQKTTAPRRAPDPNRMSKEEQEAYYTKGRYGHLVQH